MGKTARILVILTALLSVCAVQGLSAQTDEKIKLQEAVDKALCLLGEKVKTFPFYVYNDGRSGADNFFPSGNMGDFISVGVNTYWSEIPHSGTSCVKIVYKNRRDSTYGWAGLYWQYPANNWGNIPQAYDLSGATKLTFWARGEEGGEVINKFQVGGISGTYRDSGVASIGPITLSREWREYTIDLKRMDNSIIVNAEDKECWPFLEPLTRIIGGFCWATSMAANREQDITFYLDEIRFE